MSSQLFIACLALLLIPPLLPILFNVSSVNARKLCLGVFMLGSMVLAVLCSYLLITEKRLLFEVSGLLPFLEMTINVDRLSAFFILIISIIAFCSGVYSIGYIEHILGNAKKNIIIFLMGLFVLSMVLVVASSNMIVFLFFWELMSLSSFFLVMSEYDKKDTGKAGLFYFIMTQLGTVFLIFSFALIYAHTGSFDISAASHLPPSVASLIFVCLFVGFGVKAGVIPFHKWLPYAHSAAPSNISALMSGVMIKVAIYALIRFTLDVLSPQIWWGIVILIFGCISALLGVIYALKEHDLKRLLAYHSIENIGIILIGFGLYIIFSLHNYPAIAALALAGSLFHTLNHALFKSLLFMGAGAVINSTKTRNIEEMGGLIKHMPYTAAFFLIGSISISALPPFNGFVSEFMIFQAFIQSGFLPFDPFMKVLLFISLSVFALTSALAAACFVKAFGITFLAMPRSEHAKTAKEAPLPMLAGQAILAGLCILLGVFSLQIFSWLGISLVLPDLMLMTIMAIFAFAAIFLFLAVFANRRKRISETWGCGIISQDGRMEYTASGFSEPIVTIFGSIYRTKKHFDAAYYDSRKSLFKSGEAQIHMIKFFEEYFYLPVAGSMSRLSAVFSRFQAAIEPDSYLLQMLVAIMMILMLGWWFI